jgi:hypothetical protein
MDGPGLRRRQGPHRALNILPLSITTASARERGRREGKGIKIELIDVNNCHSKGGLHIVTKGMNSETLQTLRHLLMGLVVQL